MACLSCFYDHYGQRSANMSTQPTFVIFIVFVAYQTLSQGVMLSISSTVGLSLNRHIVSAILSFRKSLRSGELRFYSCCNKTKPPVGD